MGGKPTVVKMEELAWVRDHSLQVSPEFRTRFTPLVYKFAIGTQAQMCSRRCSFGGISYYHYYISNGTWVIEFGGGDISENTVEVHNRRVPADFLIEKTFVVNQDHVQRMLHVVGATNYSLSLRNCEHVARYIHSGAWICMQMLPSGELSKSLLHYMMGQSKKLINQMPAELHSSSIVPEPIYPGHQGHIKLISANKQGFNASDEKAFNVVIVGPTGSGKSSLINRLFNKTICKEGSSAASVTREMSIFEGEARIDANGKGRVRNTKVNVVDTIGFCDSNMKPAEVVQLIKFWLKVQKTTIDKVIVVLSGRIEDAHATSIKEMMKWLDFHRHFGSFVFVYNKADTVHDEAVLTSNVATMSQMLENGFHQALLTNAEGQRECLDMNMPMGIPPAACYEESELALAPLIKAVFLDVQTGRIPVDTSRCVIL